MTFYTFNLKSLERYKPAAAPALNNPKDVGGGGGFDVIFQPKGIPT